MSQEGRSPGRKGRALLVAGVGLATVSFVACSSQQGPVGNLRAPDPAPDAGAAQAAVEPPPPPSAAVAGDAAAPAVGTPTPSAAVAGDAGAPVTPRLPRQFPVGNLRPPLLFRDGGAGPSGTGQP